MVCGVLLIMGELSHVHFITHSIQISARTVFWNPNSGANFPKI